MATGLRIFGSGGAVQFDSTAPNYFVAAQGVETSGFTANVDGMFQKTITLPAQVTPLLVAIRPVTYPAFVLTSGQYVDPANPALGLTITQFTILSTSPSPTVYWYAFTLGDAPAMPALPPYALVVYDALGKITYRSDQKVLRMAGVVAGASFSGSATLTSGRTYAFITGGHRIAYSGSQVSRCGGLVSGNVVTFAPMGVASQSTGGRVYPPYMNNIIVDVTNY